MICSKFAICSILCENDIYFCRLAEGHAIFACAATSPRWATEATCLGISEIAPSLKFTPGDQPDALSKTISPNVPELLDFLTAEKNKVRHIFLVFLGNRLIGTICLPPQGSIICASSSPQRMLVRQLLTSSLIGHWTRTRQRLL